MLEARNVRKTYGGTVALDGASLALEPGSIHAVLGENGAGKSTLMRVLFGLVRPEGGELLLEGAAYRPGSPADALSAGLGMVHQHFTLVPTLTAAENLGLGQGKLWRWTSRRSTNAHLASLASGYGMAVPPDAPVGSLSVGEKQRIEILKALARGARYLILDEPTGVLSPLEVEELFATLRRLRDQGVAVAFISHKLWEVEAVADQVTVLRRGRTVLTGGLACYSRQDLVTSMVGSGPGETRRGAEGVTRPGAPLLLLESLSALGDGGRPGILEVSLQVARGEILGVAGVEGNGQRELAECLVGLRRASAGALRLDGLDLSHLSTGARRAAGLAYIPEDRHAEGLVLPLSVRENLLLSKWGGVRKGLGLLDVAASRREAVEAIARYGIRPADPEMPVSALSGGNQQKAVVAREMSAGPKAVLAANPTRGLDLGAAAFVHSVLRDHRAKGGACLLVSSELEELLEICDRIAVMRQGRVVSVVPPSAGRETLGQLMVGGVRCH
ncbi:MAG TPA: ABC transporter ATP-binding protein [Armatimonadota bacterium]|jgi:simple sugar transport system ATP-binding protein